VAVVKYILLKFCAFLFFRVVKQVTRGIPPNTCSPRVGVARTRRPGRPEGQELKAGPEGQDQKTRKTRRPGAEGQEDQKTRTRRAGG